MTEPNSGRPSSSAAVYPSSPRPSPSVVSRASRSSLRRDHDRQESPLHHQPTSAAYIRAPSQSPPPPRTRDDAAVGPSSPHQRETLASFAPFFPLVTTSAHPSQHQTTHHPILHYVFADDDPDLLTEALAQHHHGGAHADVENEGGNNLRERAVVLDIIPADHGPGYEVAWASSLSPDWAVVSTSISRMGDANGALAAAHGDGHGALVLTVEGVSVEPSLTMAPPAKTPSPEAELQSPGASGTRPLRSLHAAEEYSGLLSDFDKRMGVLRRVVEAGGDRKRLSTAQGAKFEEQHLS